MLINPEDFQKYINICLSDKDILKLIDTNIILYHNLKNYKSINQMLKNNCCEACRSNSRPGRNDCLKHHSAIILYQSDLNFGHWCCINKIDKNIYFFDSYGMFPDKQKDYLNESEYVKKLNETDEMKRLIKQSIKKGYHCYYNHNRLQSKNTSTCGYWCVSFIKYNKSEDDFYNTLTEAGFSF